MTLAQARHPIGVLAAGLVVAFAAGVMRPAAAAPDSPSCQATRDATADAGASGVATTTRATAVFAAQRGEAGSLPRIATTGLRPRLASWQLRPGTDGTLDDPWSRFRLPEVELGANARPLAATTPRPDIWGPAQEQWLRAGLDCRCGGGLFRADLRVTTTDSADPATTGGPLSYSIAVDNFGPDDAVGLTLVDTLPVQTTFVSSSPGSPVCAHAGGVVTCDLGQLANGATSFVGIDVTIAPGFTGTLMNTVQVSASTFDPVASNDIDVETTTVQFSSPGRAPDGVAGIPLRIAKSAGAPMLDLTWGASCEATASDYSVHEGQIGSYYSHTTLACSTSGALSATVMPSPGDRYYLIVPLTADAEGSYGTQSNGAERPDSVTTCRASSVVAPCP